MQKLLWWFVDRPRLLEGSALILVLILSLMASGLTGCVQTISTRDMQTALAEAANQQVPVTDNVRKRCEAAPLPKATSTPEEALGEARAFGTLQTGYLDICDKYRQLAVDTIDTHNAGARKVVNELRPLHWWERIFGRRLAK